MATRWKYTVPASGYGASTLRKAVSFAAARALVALARGMTFSRLRRRCFCAIVKLAAGRMGWRCMFNMALYAFLIFGFPFGVLVGYMWRDHISRARRARYL